MKQCNAEYPNLPSQTLTQCLGDNVDLNIVTIDSQRSVHGLGIIAASVIPYNVTFKNLG
jgi:hypothetical protein